MNFTFEVNRVNWETTEALFEKIFLKVNNLTTTQLPQRNGLSHFVIFAESGKNKTYYISLDGFGHAFDIMTGEGHAKYQISDKGFNDWNSHEW
jgi:hypothetical protein